MGKHKRNKRRERTEQLLQQAYRFLMNEQAQNAIEQHNFDKLVRQGIIVREIEK